MSKIEEKDIEVKDVKQDRRYFFKQFGKYLLGFTAFAIASFLGLKHEGELRLGKMKNVKLGLSEAHGECGASYDCSGGGGQCGSSYNCSGGGKDSGGHGQCGSSYNCSGGGGECGASYNCSGQ